MKYTRHQRHKSKHRRRSRRHHSKFTNRRRYNTRRRIRHRRKIKHRQSGGENGLIQLGYNAGRGMTSTITNFINTYVGNTPSASPQATKSQYHAYT